MPHFSSCCGADEYICQSCGRIYCGKCSPSQWRPEIVGNNTAASVCPECVGEYDARVKDPTLKSTRTKKTWTETEIGNLLLTRKTMVERSLLKMWSLQTHNEQSDKETKYVNSVGFNKPDGMTLSRFVENLQRYGSFKSDKQVNYVRKRLLKYTKQLTMIANGEISEAPKVTSFRTSTMRNRAARRKYGFTSRGSGYHG